MMGRLIGVQGKACGYVPSYFFTSNPSGTGTCVDRAKLQVDKNMIPFCTLQFMNKTEYHRWCGFVSEHV